jgi:sec-independent protein translocase protein TatC
MAARTWGGEDGVRGEAGKYYGFVTQLTIACGLLAELPIAVLALAGLGVVTGDFLRKTRTYAYLLILILVAIVNPAPDPVTFLLVTLPVWAIYELCIWIVWFVERARSKKIVEGYGD